MMLLFVLAVLAFPLVTKGQAPATVPDQGMYSHKVRTMHVLNLGESRQHRLQRTDSITLERA